MTLKTVYLDGVTGLNTMEGDLWNHGPRFQVPGGDPGAPTRPHIFKNEGVYFTDALGADYNVWFGELNYIVPKNMDTAFAAPWAQAGCYIRHDAIYSGLGFNFPFQFRYWTTTVGYYASTVWGMLNTGYINHSSGGTSDQYYPMERKKWYWLECRQYHHTSSGIAEIRIDGTAIYRWTGIPTMYTYGGPTGEIDVNYSIFWPNDWYSYSNQPKFDNLYFQLADTENELTWHNDGLVAEPIFPVGDGDETQGDPSGPTSWQSVNEPHDDYLYVTSDAGERDCYSMSNIETDRTRTVNAVRAVIRARRSTAGYATIRPYVRIGSTNYYGDTVHLGCSWRQYAHIWDVNPATSVAWTSSDVNSVQVGWERVA